jgi:thienamycin biosynthesis protein ThnO
MQRLECRIGRARRATCAARALRGVRGDVVAVVPQAPRLLQLLMVEAASAAGARLRALDDRAWLALLRDAARRFVEDELPLGGAPMGLSEHARLVAEATGIPTLQVVQASLRLAEVLARMEETLDAQGLGPGAATRGEGWVLAPAGRHVAVRIPGDHPAINATWLTALGMRRASLLCAAGDPLTSTRLLEALYAAGLPDGALSLCFDRGEALFEQADQVIWPGDEPDQLGGQLDRVKRYDHAGSKALLLEPGSEALWERLSDTAVRGSGRLCTNLSALLVSGDAEAAGAGLAEALARWTVAPLDDADAIVPAFPDRDLARQIEAAICAAEERGAVDLSAQVVGGPRLVELDGALFLRPTVLLVDRRDPLLGADLPFPFVTVAWVPRADMARTSRGSLMVSMLGDDDDLLRQLVLEPTIDKVCHGGGVDRGARAADPHEGLLADFLFRKKSVWTESWQADAV